MKIAVLSALYGSYDNPAPPPPQDTEAEWIMVSDRDYDCPPWRTVVEPRLLAQPRLAAKVPKARPDLYADADVYIWIDANMRICAPDFVAWCVDVLGDAALGLTPQPQAATMAGELALAYPQPRYARLPLPAQVDHYLAQGFPDGWGNWWTGLIIRRATCPEFGDSWLREMLRWSHQDQIALPYVLHQMGLQPKNIPQGWFGRFGWSEHHGEPEWDWQDSR